MGADVVKVNRAPVLTLWAAVVAQRLGFDKQEALTLGKTVAGLNAQSKGQRLGIFTPGEESGEKARERERDEEFYISLLGRSIPAVNTDEGIRAVAKGKPVNPESVERYLESKFGDRLPEVRQAMEALSDSYSPIELSRVAYKLYEEFRPKIPEGKKGWGAAGVLKLDQMKALENK